MLASSRAAALVSISALVPPAAAWSQAGPDAPAWAVSCGFMETVSSKVLLESPADSADLVSRFHAGLEHSRRAPRLDLDWRLRGSGQVYREQSRLDRVNYAGSLSGSLRVSPRAVFNFADALTTAYTHDQPLLEQAGLVLPLTPTRSNSALAELSYQLSSKTSSTVGVHHDWLRFDSPDFSGGWLLSADAGLARQLGGGDSLGVSYRYQRHATRARQGEGHTLSGVWGGKLSRRLEAGLSAGATRFRSVGQDSTRTAPYVSGRLSLHFERGSLAARYTHSLQPAYGFGRDRQADVVSLSYRASLGRRVEWALTSSGSYSRDPDDSSFEYTSQAHVVNLSYRFARWLTAAAGAALRQRHRAGATSSLSAVSGTLAIVYAREWP